MLVTEFEKFVEKSDQTQDLPSDIRLQVAVEGLTSEIGSVVSAIKKEALKEGGALTSKLAKQELGEELGDVLWYVFAVAALDSGPTHESVLFSDISALRSEIGGVGSRGDSIRAILTENRAREFLDKAADFLSDARRTFGEYQKLATLTARTEGETLLTVCAAVMSQLGAQLMRHLLPEVEINLNQQLKDRPIRIILAEICWHVSAVATLYQLDLDEIVQQNIEKNKLRQIDGEPTPLHDRDQPLDEQFPRRMVVTIKSDADRVSKMYWNGAQLGDPLRDNAYEPDGYRFHDVMHLANLAHLGWSPVLRKLMGLKRKSCKSLDDVEDGGRAVVVEEAIVKIVHAEADRRASARQPDIAAEDRALFPPEEEIPFGLIKQIQQLARGHEVYKNKAWEWTAAIRSGYKLFQELRKFKGGIITLDMEARTIDFAPPAED